jgi:myo-inositol-1(or 4)-monophosphatase
LAYTACGRFDGFFEYGLSPWDVAGGIIIIEEAGGIVKDFKGEGDMIFGRTILGSSSAIYNELSGIIKKHFTNY